jgi:hypothetical protein
METVHTPSKYADRAPTQLMFFLFSNDLNGALVLSAELKESGLTP